MARAIVTSAHERGLNVPRASDFEAIPGYGAQASLDGRRLAVGGPNLMARLELTPPSDLASFADEAASSGQGVIYLVEGEPRARRLRGG